MLHVAIFWKVNDALACNHAVLDSDTVSLGTVRPWCSKIRDASLT